MSNITISGDEILATTNIGVLKDKDTKVAYLEQLLVQVASGRGGSGDYTREKYESPSEDLEKICAELDAMAAARRRNRAE